QTDLVDRCKMFEIIQQILLNILVRVGKTQRVQGQAGWPDPKRFVGTDTLRSYPPALPPTRDDVAGCRVTKPVCIFRTTARLLPKPVPQMIQADRVLLRHPGQSEDVALCPEGFSCVPPTLSQWFCHFVEHGFNDSLS